MNVLILIIVVIAALLLYVFTRPASFRIERSMRIRATPEKLFALINDFHQWGSWSPWEILDPSMARAYGNVSVGKGAVYEWQGNKKVGKGRMEIVDSIPSKSIRIKLDFFAPVEAHNTTEFSFQAQGDVTEVRWAMFGPSPFMSRLMSLFFNMDKMVGGDFERGLSNLKNIAEH